MIKSLRREIVSREYGSTRIVCDATGGVATITLLFRGTSLTVDVDPEQASEIASWITRKSSDLGYSKILSIPSKIGATLTLVRQGSPIDVGLDLALTRWSPGSLAPHQHREVSVGPRLVIEVASWLRGVAR